jgi:hypothetical protein
MLTTINSRIIHEKGIIIPIKQNLFTSMKENSPKGEYSLKQNFFDPSKSSPPNEFMIKLHMRLSKFDMKENFIGSIIYKDIKDDSCVNE